MTDSNKKDEPRKDLETLLSEIGGGLKVSISRIMPRWCDGHIDTLEMGEDDTISLETLREQYGGRQLRIKIIDPDNKGRIVAARDIRFPDPPKEAGIEIPEPEQKKADSKNDLLTMFMESQKQIAAAQSENQKLLFNTQSQHQKSMMDMTAKQNETIQSLLRERLEESKEQATAAGPHKSLQDMASTVEFVEDMKDRFRGKDDENVNPIHKELLEMGQQFLAFQMDKSRAVFDVELQKKQQAETPPDLPERQQVRQNAQTAPQTAQTAPQSSTMGDLELLTLAAQRFKNMELDEQRQVAQMFFGQMEESEPVNSSDQDDHSVESQDNSNKDDDIDSGDNGQDVEIELDPDDRDELSRGNIQ